MKVVDVYHIKSVVEALQNQTQSLIRAGAHIPDNLDKKKFDKATAYLAEAISTLDEWIEFYDKVTSGKGRP